jgi:hypothetical protein
MLTWDQAVERISQSDGAPSLKSGIRWPWISRLRVVVTGSSGCGKTELWRHLTLKDKPDEISQGSDEGYYFRKKGHSALALTTIPGQISDKRTQLNDKFFSGPGKLNGVVFVAAYGYNFIWPGKVESVATSLNPFSLNKLRDRNSIEELQTFDETCKFIAEKWSKSSEENRPKWLLVLANKVDLYWSDVGDAYGYYRLGASDFGRSAEILTSKLSGSGFRYHVLPTAFQPRDYEFDSTILGNLKTASSLSREQCEASVNVLVDALEDLSGA